MKSTEQLKSGFQLRENREYKIFNSPNYNYIFNKRNGFHARWGKTKQDDPDYSKFGPEITDIEISTICNGLGIGKSCRFCYKSNTSKGSYMGFETFKKVFHNLPRTLTQIAFGIGDIDANPDMWKIFEYCRSNNHNYVVPNVTTNGYKMTPEILDKLASMCGAVAVSRYNPQGFCYNTVNALTGRGMKQVNIHMLLSAETYDECMQVLQDAQEDPRLEKLNAIVFLALKPKGRGKSLTPLRDASKYKKLINYALSNNINIGFDSCGCHNFLKAVQDHKNFSTFKTLAEPCESSLFSIYIDVNAKCYPCSFATDIDSWAEGIDMLSINSFSTDIWHSSKLNSFRNKLLETKEHNTLQCRECPIYDLSMS